MSDVSLASMERIIREQDPNIRISGIAKTELRNAVEDYGRRISEIAVSIARHSNRSTVMEQDIIAAREQLMIGVGFHQNQLSR